MSNVSPKQPIEPTSSVKQVADSVGVEMNPVLRICAGCLCLAAVAWFLGVVTGCEPLISCLVK